MNALAEEQFLQSQHKYLAYLRFLNHAKISGTHAELIRKEQKRILGRWHDIGILNENREVTEMYRNVILEE